MRNEFKEAVPDFVKNQSDIAIKKFIDLKPEKALASYKKDFEEMIRNKRELEESIQNKNDILKLSEPSRITIPSFIELNEAVSEIATILSTSFEDLEEEAIGKLRTHIENNLGDDEGAESWIRQGLPFVDSGNCPFCGQNLKNAQGLIDTYRHYFNETYIDFIDKVNSTLDNSLTSIALNLNAENKISEVLLSLKDYDARIKDDAFRKAVSEIEVSKQSVVNSELKLSEAVLSIRRTFKDSISKKKQKPYRSITSPKNEIEPIIAEYRKFLDQLNGLVGKTIETISEYKNKFRDDSVLQELQVLKNDISALEMKIARLEQDGKCQSYQNKSLQIKLLEEVVTTISSKLETEQKTYLDKYFRLINEYFKKLGSNNYGIGRSISNRGDKKVFGIVVKFKGSEVSNADLPFIFGESDRRALALSIFWARIHSLEVNERQSKIIILDDPVTSFDDNRIIKNNDIIWQLNDKVDQIILLTHYPTFIREFYKRCHMPDQCVFLEIKQNHETSYLEKLEVDLFCSSEMEQQFYAITDFINKKTLQDIRQKLRPYLENHLNALFFKCLSENNLLNQKLENKIDGLCKYNAISSSLKKRLHKYRKETNPEAHIFTSSNEEDIRSFASELLDFLYNTELKESII
jgi:wobble nucleotide-excising tRNase